MTAYQDAWIIGDNFLREIYNTLTNIRNRSALNRRRPPYLFDFYNVFGYFQNRQSLVPGMTCMLNAYIEALNNRLKLPKYIFWIPDVDLLSQVEADQNDCAYL